MWPWCEAHLTERTSGGRCTSQQSARIFVRKTLILWSLLSRYKHFYCIWLLDICSYNEHLTLSLGKWEIESEEAQGRDSWTGDNWREMHYVLCWHKNWGKKGKRGPHGNKLCLKSSCTEACLALCKPVWQSQYAWQKKRDMARREKLLQWAHWSSITVRALHDNCGLYWELVSTRGLILWWDMNPLAHIPWETQLWCWYSIRMRIKKV